MKIGYERFVEDVSATRAMENIFGPNVIKTVWVEKEMHDIRRQNKAKWIKDGSLNWDYASLVVEMVNGRKVLMRNSEWASFTRTDNS